MKPCLPYHLPWLFSLPLPLSFLSFSHITSPPPFHLLPPPPPFIPLSLPIPCHSVHEGENRGTIRVSWAEEALEISASGSSHLGEGSGYPCPCYYEHVGQRQRGGIVYNPVTSVRCVIKKTFQLNSIGVLALLGISLMKIAIEEPCLRW